MDGTVSTESHMHMANGKIAAKTTTKTMFQVPPMDPEDWAIPY